jgi:hypothetical protein
MFFISYETALAAVFKLFCNYLTLFYDFLNCFAAASNFLQLLKTFLESVICWFCLLIAECSVNQFKVFK